MEGGVLCGIPLHMLHMVAHGCPLVALRRCMLMMLTKLVTAVSKLALVLVLVLVLVSVERTIISVQSREGEIEREIEGGVALAACSKHPR